MTTNPIIVALDVDSAEEARELVIRLGDAVGFYKVGLELYTVTGTDFVKELIDRGKKVFVDLKLYDISETVKRAAWQVAKSGASLLTVHGSSSVMRAALEGRGDSGLKIIAVTVLTSFDDADLKDFGYDCSVQDLVNQVVQNAHRTGVDGLVCSPVEVARVRKLAGPEKILVTPGVRSAGAAAGDQKRIATPADAVAGGATYLVIGRQITRAKDPAAEALRVLGELKTKVAGPATL